MARLATLLAVIAAAFAAVPAVAGAAQIAQRSDAIGGPNAPEHFNRFIRDGLPSFCGEGPSAPGNPETGPSKYDYHRYPFRSSIEEPACVTVTLATSCAGADEVMSETYSPSYDPNSITANWIADLGNSPPAATSYSFTLPPGTQFETVVDERNDGASCTGVTTTWTSDRPWASGRVFIDGVPALGESVNAEQDVWAESPTVTKQWVRCDGAGANCTDIPGATASQYAPTDEDIGHTLRVRETATDVTGTSTTLAPPTDRVFVPIDVHDQGLGPGDASQQGRLSFGTASTCEAPKSPPALVDNNLHLYDAYPLTSIVNEPQCIHVAKPLNPCGLSNIAVYSPSFNPAAITQNYVADNGGFNLAMSYTLAPGATAVNVIAEEMLGSCPNYHVVIGSDAPFAQSRPAISGDPTEGQQLTTSNGAWSGTPSFAYEWRRCDAQGAACAAIPGAGAATYTPTADDVGRRLRTRVTATQGGSASSDSEPTAVIAAAPPTQPGAPGAPGAPGGQGNGGPDTPLDRTAPKGTIRLGSSDLARAVKTGRVPVTVNCDEACSAVVQVRVTRKLAKALGMGRKTVIATAKGNAAAGRRTTLRGKLARKARRALRRRKSLKLSLAASFTDAAGNKATQNRKGTLKRRRASR
jgi:hypothetical protein